MAYVYAFIVVCKILQQYDNIGNIVTNQRKRLSYFGVGRRKERGTATATTTTTTTRRKTIEGANITINIVVRASIQRGEKKKYQKEKCERP
jgi:hypothetical protein